jgi:hypothetical protein
MQSMLAFTLDNLLFLLLIAGAAFFQLLSKAVNKAGKSDSKETSSTPKPQAPRPIQRAPQESDADRIRKFLEALGQPPSSTPPPPVVRRTDVPPRPVAPVQPPPVIIPRAFGLPRERRPKTDAARRGTASPEQPTRLREIVPPPVPLSAAAFEVHDALSAEFQQSSIVEPPIEVSTAPKAFGVAKRADSKMNIAALLGSGSSLRQAILVREILGPPRGLQPLDVTP